MVKRHVNFPGNTQRLAVILLLSFAAGHYKSYWSGCIKAAIVICQQIFSILALGFPFNLKIVLFEASAPRSGFGGAIFHPVAQVL